MANSENIDQAVIDTPSLTLSQYAEKHGLSKAMVYDMIKRGLLCPVYFGPASPRITPAVERDCLERLEGESRQHRDSASRRARQMRVAALQKKDGQ